MCTPKAQPSSAAREMIVIDSLLLDAATRRAHQTRQTIGEVIDAALRRELASAPVDARRPDRSHASSTS